MTDRCICPRFSDLPEGTIIADLTCPIHGVDGSDPGDVLPPEYDAPGSAEGGAVTAVGYGPFNASYPVDDVECHRCQGSGEVDTWDDCFGEGWTRCWDCGGSGVQWVCANCYDDWDGCTVCQHPSSSGGSST